MEDLRSLPLDQLLPQFLEWLSHYNAVDVVLFVFLALYALDGMRRGFIAGALGLLALALTVAVAALGAAPAGQAIAQALRMPDLLANTLGFFAVLIVAQLATSLAVKVILGALAPVRLVLAPIMFLDHALGVFPGLIQAILIAMLVLTPLQLFPLIPQVNRALEASTLAREIPRLVESVTPYLDQALGRQALRPGVV
ncbi:MAG TPA: CvpA family protein [Chloroflexota bacterium]|nr:CvpA family protein [Chloroflexota bacterium]